MDTTKTEWRLGTVDEVTTDGIAIRADVYQRQDGQWFAGVLVGGRTSAALFATEAEALAAANGWLALDLERARGQVPLFTGIVSVGPKG